MGFGSILVGIAVAGIVLVYVARPFREVNADFDKAIEAWVRSVQVDGNPSTDAPATQVSAPAPTPPPSPAVEMSGVLTAEPPINFCPNCGQGVQPDDRFCPRCGNRLRK